MRSTKQTCVEFGTWILVLVWNCGFGISNIGWAAQASPISAHASIDKKEVGVGEPVTYTITIEAPPDATIVWPDIGSTLGDWMIQDRGETRRSTPSPRSPQRWYRLASFSVGAHPIPATSLTVRTAEGTSTPLTLDPLPVAVVSALPATDWHSLDIQAEKPPMMIVPWALLGLIIAGIPLAIGTWIWWRRRSPEVPHEEIPQPSPHEEALQALEALERSRLLADQQFDAFTLQLSNIVRRYIEKRFGVHAPEMTTEEFLQAAASAQALSSKQQTLLREFLNQCDMVKFARYQLSAAEGAALLDAARQFVHETIPQVSGITPGVPSAP